MAKKKQAKRFVSEHEFDFEPTYVTDTRTVDRTYADQKQTVVTMDPSLPWQLRARLASLIISELDKADPVLVTPQQLKKSEDR